jgi:protein-S-isoprenylcysteine O-methyltransferase Ste14
MNGDTRARPTGRAPVDQGTGTLARLVGSGHKVGLVALPVLIAGVTANILDPSLFQVGGPPPALGAVSLVVLAVGVVVWGWSVVLILTKVPRGELITTGPYAVVKHPLYTGVALLVLPWLGFLLDSWVGVLIGGALYVGSRLFAPEEEAELAERFGERWTHYQDGVWIPWL